MGGVRKERVAEAIRKEISTLLQNGVKDVRIGFTTITRVQVSPDLKNATIFFSILGSDKEKRDSEVGLRRASGFLRREVGQRLKLRYAPALLFKPDRSLDHSFHIDAILRKIKDKDSKVLNEQEHEPSD